MISQMLALIIFGFVSVPTGTWDLTLPFYSPSYILFHWRKPDSDDQSKSVNMFKLCVSSKL